MVYTLYYWKLKVLVFLFNFLKLSVYLKHFVFFYCKNNKNVGLDCFKRSIVFNAISYFCKHGICILYFKRSIVFNVILLFVSFDIYEAWRAYLRILLNQ